jgi:D-aminoacyl-tRNA deacylase
MKAVVQRVQQAAVEVDGTEIGRIGSGLLVFLGVAKGDGEADSRFMIDKISGLRIFNDPQGKMNRCLKSPDSKRIL